MWAEKSPHPKSPRRVRRAERVMMHVKLLPSFTSLHFNFSSQGEEIGLYPFSSMNGVPEILSAQLRGPTFINCQVCTHSSVLFSPLPPPFWFVSFKKKNKRDKTSQVSSDGAQIVKFALVCLALCEEALNSELWTLYFLRESALLTSLLGRRRSRLFDSLASLLTT